MLLAESYTKLNSVAEHETTNEAGNIMIMKMSFKVMNKTLLWTLLLLCLSKSVPLSEAFNVDVNSKVIHEAPKRSCEDGDCMFGFSVAQHREQNQPW